MKILILNMPHDRKIIRKYTCSFYASGFLYPVIELLRVASILKHAMPQNEIIYIDAVAEGIHTKKCISAISSHKPDVIITMTSVDFINDEIAFIEKLKEHVGAKLVGIGYLLDLFREKYLQFDALLGRDFEQRLSLAATQNIADVDTFTALLKNPTDKPLPFQPDRIRMIDYSFVRPHLYEEFHVKGKTAFMYFSYGCSYHCAFCLKSYNLDKAYMRRREDIFDELAYLHKEGYKNIRIMDDNCTWDHKFLKQLADFLKTNNFHFNFYGLTRFDLIDRELIGILKSMGFKRLYLGLETLNEKQQETYLKNIKLKNRHIENKTDLLHNAGIECALFFLFNPITDTKKDVNRILCFIKPLAVSYANLSFLVPYPNTRVFTDYKSHINFSEPPDYRSEFKNQDASHVKIIEFYFLFSFYFLSFKNFYFAISRLLKYPKQTLKVTLDIVKFLFAKNRERKDFF